MAVIMCATILENMGRSVRSCAVLLTLYHKHVITVITVMKEEVSILFCPRMSVPLEDRKWKAMASLLPRCWQYAMGAGSLAWEIWCV